jgi:triosephosphate isomerase (TIM)
MGVRTKLVAGNWKMNFTAKEAAAVVESFARLVDAKSNVDVVICPPFMSIARVRDLVRDTHIKVGAQDVFWMETGAFTGKIGPRMLDEFGVNFCIVGHSETRGRFGKLEVSPSTIGFFGETDETVNLKIKAILFHSMNPILCVGETAEERAAGRTDEVIRTQLTRALDGIDWAELFFLSVAYEPVWAIGTGNVCDAGEAERVCAMIRATLAELLDPAVSEEVRILYGGSVKASNCDDLFARPNIDGALVGGASLDPNEFSRIVMSA